MRDHDIKSVTALGFQPWLELFRVGGALRAAGRAIPRYHAIELRGDADVERENGADAAEPTHPRDAGRFARHADGRVEFP